MNTRLLREPSRIAAAVSLAASFATLKVAPAQSAAPTVPLARALALVQTLHERDAERESVVLLADVSPAGVRYEWSFLETHAKGDTIRETFQRFVRAADLDTTPRWHVVFEPAGPLEHPGYTAFTISRATFDLLRSAGSAPYSVLAVEDQAAGSGLLAMFGGARPAMVRWRGTLTRVGAATEPFPLLVSGQRVSVPALHLKGSFTARSEKWAPDIWVLAQRDHPLILKLEDAARVFQTVRADLGAGANGSASIEAALARTCRVEVPGIYFEFNSAVLNPASDATIATLAEILARHADWPVTVEGHTDSIGTSAANQSLSERRAAAVRDRLANRGVAAARLRAVGYGQTKPRETNTTVEGRARNRRVELLRPCGGAR